MNLWLIFCEKLADNVINAENMRHFREDYAGGSAKLISCVSLKSTQQITIPFKIFHQPPPMGFSFVAATTILDNNPTRFFLLGIISNEATCKCFFFFFVLCFIYIGGWLVHWRTFLQLPRLMDWKFSRKFLHLICKCHANKPFKDIF